MYLCSCIGAMVNYLKPVCVQVFKQDSSYYLLSCQVE